MNLELLPLDIFKLILVKLNPEDIFSLTEIGPEYHIRCHASIHFILDRFYPYVYYTDNPWRQFVALHNNVRTHIDVSYHHVSINTNGYGAESNIDRMLMLTGKISVEKINTIRHGVWGYYTENNARQFSDYKPIVIKGLIAETTSYWFMSGINNACMDENGF